MCYRPIHINNPIKDYNPHIDSASLDVPCGHCPDCVAKRKDEWFVRLYYEFVETKNLGGYTIYLTLSYRNEDLPLYNGKLLVPSSTYKNKSVLSFETITKRSHQDADGIAVFQRKDLTTWTKSIKNRLLTAAKKAHLTDPKLWNRSIKFFVVPEFGGVLSRPHYHALVFCKERSIPFDLLLNIVKSSWEGYTRSMSSSRNTKGSIVDNVHGFGFCMHGKDGWSVKNPHAIKYLLKYLTKDMCTDNVVFNRLLESHPCDVNSDDYKAMRLSVRPFVYASPSLGSYIAAKDNVGRWLNINESYKVQIPESIGNKVIVKDYHIPKAIEKLIFCDRFTKNVPDSDPNRIRPYVRQTRYALTEDGLRYSAYKMSQMAHNTYYVYESFRKFLESSDGKLFLENQGLDFNFVGLVEQYRYSQLDFLCAISAYDVTGSDTLDNYLYKLQVRSARVRDDSEFNSMISDVPWDLSYTLSDTNMMLVYKVFFTWLYNIQHKVSELDTNVERLQSVHRYINNNLFIV